jgi:hypothetical protein
MSLTITGQVHRMILFWDDGHRSDTYYGLDNTNSSSRFSLLGEAKITPNVKMGFEIMIEVEAGGTSSKVSQFDEDGKISSATSFGIAGMNSFNGSNNDAYFGDARRVAWWLEDKNLGRMTVGRYESAGAVTTIDLAGIGQAASASEGLVNGGFAFRTTSGAWTGVTVGTLTDPAANQGRTELLRYDSPSLQGFILSASIAEAGDYWGVMLRYANEFNGVRVAAGIGYEDVTDRLTNATASPADLTVPEPEVRAWGAALSALHVPSGLFAQGHYLNAEYSCTGNAGSISQYWGQTTDCRSDGHQWLVQAGVVRNWFGLGNTTVYGEYSRNNGWGAQDAGGRTFAAPTVGTGQTTLAIAGVTDTEMTVWGVGVVQQVDAAASTLYLTYRHFSGDVTSTTPGVSLDDFQAVTAGAVVKF